MSDAATSMADDWGRKLAMARAVFGDAGQSYLDLWRDLAISTPYDSDFWWSRMWPLALKQRPAHAIKEEELAHMRIAHAAGFTYPKWIEWCQCSGLGPRPA